MFLISRWWILAVYLSAVFPRCSTVHVFVRDERRYAVLFQSVVLPCQYTSVSTQTPVVQWVYKSYCRDRTRDSFSFSDSLGGSLGGVGGAGTGYTDMEVLQIQRHLHHQQGGPAHRGGAVGDSGVYICKVIISDDLEGQNEASVELLVLEWVFVAAVALGSVLFLLLLLVLPDTCCCPRHLYEAGKGIKTGPSTPIYPPYFVSGVPAMVPIAPPSLVDKSSVSVPPSDATLVTVPIHTMSAPYHRVPSVQDQNSLRVLQYVEKQLAHFNPARSTSLHSSSASELSSLHEGENNFRKTFRNVQKKALPAIIDVDFKPEPEPQRPSRLLVAPFSGQPARHYQNNPPSPQRHRKDPPSPQRYRKDPPSPKRYRDEPDFRQDKPLLQRRFSEDAPAPPHSRKTGTKQSNHRDPDQLRWNPRSEHLQRKAYRSGERSVSLDELEEFAFRTLSDEGEGRRGAQTRGPTTSCTSLTNTTLTTVHLHSPFSFTQKQEGTWDTDRPVPPPPPKVSPPSSSSQEKDYDPTFLNSLLDRKAKLRGVSQEKGTFRGDGGSESKSSGELHRHSPNNRPDGDSLLYSDTERNRSPSWRIVPLNSASPQTSALVQPGRRDETREKPRKMVRFRSYESEICDL
ncbi:hypothetical protein WMY93_019182 [Mugilogobius chulae]|uniref:Ig-like domain-containing protein n=1 Tax=Mugilogobius chulae TaxID=88201 RepID=A0AAW0NJ10_9GOBI